MNTLFINNTKVKKYKLDIVYRKVFCNLDEEQNLRTCAKQTFTPSVMFMGQSRNGMWKKARRSDVALSTEATISP